MSIILRRRNSQNLSLDTNSDTTNTKISQPTKPAFEDNYWEMGYERKLEYERYLETKRGKFRY